jgi:hypothetical protein
MLKREQLRVAMIVLLAVAAVLSVVGNKIDEPWLVRTAFLAFFAAVFLYADWRRRAAAARRGKVFDRKAKTDETRSSPDE